MHFDKGETYGFREKFCLGSGNGFLSGRRRSLRGTAKGLNILIRSVRYRAELIITITGDSLRSLSSVERRYCSNEGNRTEGLQIFFKLGKNSSGGYRKSQSKRIEFYNNIIDELLKNGIRTVHYSLSLGSSSCTG